MQFSVFFDIAHIWAFYFLQRSGILIVQNISDTAFLVALGKRVRFLRQQKKLTQEELGFRIGNSGKQIGRIERGENNVTTSMIYAISLALDIPVSKFFEIDIQKIKKK